MKIYAVEKNLKSLLLIDGDYVVNGDYRVKFKDGVAQIPNGNKQAYFVMNSPMECKGYKGYNEVLDAVDKILKAKNEMD